MQHAGSSAFEATHRATAAAVPAAGAAGDAAGLPRSLWVIGILAACMVPIVWLAPKPLPRGAPAGAPLTEKYGLTGGRLDPW